MNINLPLAHQGKVLKISIRNNLGVLVDEQNYPTGINAPDEYIQLDYSSSIGLTNGNYNFVIFTFSDGSTIESPVLIVR